MNARSRNPAVGGKLPMFLGLSAALLNFTAAGFYATGRSSASRALDLASSPGSVELSRSLLRQSEVGLCVFAGLGLAMLGATLVLARRNATQRSDAG